ncbi:hypothetical protein GCM10009854_47620 [Saccharopolyspora halophila]|uniref:Uncharacterized protein n=1 Tax=Saccharopolyspora halophila TaxID=405551 RepID=A0ABN3GXQ1_9PSEU
MSITGYPEDDPRHHAAITQQMVSNLAKHARSTASDLDCPRAQELFSTTEQILTGLGRALSDYEHRYH